MSKFDIPRFTKALVLRKSATLQSPVYNDAKIELREIPPLRASEVLVKVGAAAFNHRELWIRKGLYPNIAFGSVFGADGAGVVVASGQPKDSLLNTRVFMSPMVGWAKSLDGPESPKFGVVGGVVYPPLGYFANYVVIDRSLVIKSASHLDDVHMAAWPLAGLTAWRAITTCAGVQSDHNILITGIGGGVALVALQLCVAKGAHVYVTSGSQEKINKAIVLGAEGGANYKDDDWPTQLSQALKKVRGKDVFDSVIDSGGGDIMSRVSGCLKRGGKVVCYGMTANPKITFTMREVMRNQHLIGTMMGSLQDMRDATAFLEEHRIVPVVSHVLEGLESAEEGFEILKRGDQFGKVVIRIDEKRPGKL
ncbi:NAD-P-binding protein [Guyanagaster necrorhizus]|uniref:NAD-P-binding protein n=1 Tax=Guyanagaster necrorhizus TaxID=856835 RepID=A0A9P7VM83_9AGAR|nr:NAD-P-binding protein [Guyanagaster necrorhizus MCA 3950]KAG7442484.1 NAD-P-binding protein [Guyanagaster necrorhizus MCA 3950]